MRRRPFWAMRRLRQALDRLGPEWDDVTIAAELGVDKSRLSRWMNPNLAATPSPEQYVRLCVIAGDAGPIKAMLRAVESADEDVSIDALCEAREALHAAVEVLDGICDAQLPSSPGGVEMLPSEAARVRPKVEDGLNALGRLLRYVEWREDGEE